MSNAIVPLRLCLTSYPFLLTLKICQAYSRYPILLLVLSMRTRIALRNLFISQLLIFIFLIFAYLRWFPYSLDKLGGFYDTALMLIFVDIILGPLLVFIVYKKDKKYLSFDINVLLGVQIIAFVYGAYALYLKHPTYMVFVNDHYKLVNASYSSPEKLNYSSLKTNFFSKPILTYTELPKNENELTQFILGVDLLGKPDVQHRADFYKPHSQELSRILSKQLNKIDLFKSQNAKLKLQQFLTKKGGNVSDYAFFPIIGNNQQRFLFVITNEGEAIGTLDINPATLIAHIN